MDDYLVGIWQILEDSYETMHLLSKACAGSYKIIFLPDSYKITIFPPEFYKITLFCQNLKSHSSGRFCQIIVFLADSAKKKRFSGRILQDYHFSVRFWNKTIYLSESDRFLQDKHPVSTRIDTVIFQLTVLKIGISPKSNSFFVIFIIKICIFYIITKGIKTTYKKASEYQCNYESNITT